MRWRRGYFHVHPHRHGDVVHAHPHVHEHAHGQHTPHEHPHEEALGRTPLAAFGIGLVHGIGGSAGAGILLVSSIDDRASRGDRARRVRRRDGGRRWALATLASATCSSRDRSRPARVRVPVLGVLGMLFGAWYALGSVEAVPYVF